MKLRLSLLPGLLLLGSVAAASGEETAKPPAPGAAAAPAACRDDPRYRSLDFWLGSWEVRPTAVGSGASPSASEISLDHDGCMVRERFSSAGYSGESFNGFDSANNDWYQFYVDSIGRAQLFRGQVSAQGVYSIRGTGRRPPGAAPDSPAPHVRMTLTRLDADHVRQVFERSMDAGTTWNAFIDLTYSRKRSVG